ncbi:MAG: phosphopantetheine-binding protein [Defluviitaleaceae bacterium]|nr:phosphopantetheine-binding protein [Defluviitaleaceae bacterium]
MIIILEKITKILQEYKNDNALQIKNSSTFEELALDSLDLVQLIIDVEEEFDIIIETNKRITTVAQLMDLIKKAKA